MRYRKSLLLLLFCLLLLTGCRQNVPAADDSSACAVYFLTQTERGRELGYEILDLNENNTTEQQIGAVIRAMRTPVNANHIALLDDSIELREIQVFGSTVVVRFSEAYDDLPAIERSMLNSAIALSLGEIEGIGYVRVSGSRTTAAAFMSETSVLLDDDDLRLTAFEVDICSVDRSQNVLQIYPLRILTEQEELTPQLVLEEMLDGQLGEAAPFDGRMDIRHVTPPNEDGMVRVDAYVPVQMDLHGRELEIWSVVNSVCACRDVESVTVTINGRAPSERGLQDCDGPLTYNESHIGSSGEYDHE